MRRHTLRGRVAAQETKRLILDDGRLTHAMKVVRFEVWARSMGSGEDPECILGLESNMGSEMNAGDNRQIAWASQSTSATSRVMGFSIVDPNHVVIQDLWIYNIADAEEANYLVELEAVEISNEQSVLQMIKERSQSVQR